MAHATPTVTVAGVGPPCKVAYSKGMAPGLVARVAIVCAVFTTAGRAHAARRPVAVVDLSATQPATQLANDLYRALLDHPQLQPLDNPRFTSALLGELEDEDGPHLARAQRYEQEAEEFLAQLDDSNAARAARNGMVELGSVRPSSPMLGLYAELAFAWGQAQIGLRKPNDAALAFALAHRLDPAHRPDPTRYQPAIVQAFEAAAVKPAVAARLEVKGEGRVWIDGVELGPAGATFDTQEGMHVVQLTGSERETRGEQVIVPQTTSTTIQPAPATEELKIKRARIALVQARDATERASAMKRLAKLLGVGDAVLIAKAGGRLTVQTWRDREPGFSAVVVHGNEEASDVLAPLAPPAKVKPEPEPLPFLPPVVEKRWYQKNWVRASIAGGVIAAVVGAIVYARRDQLLGAINPNTQWEDLR